MKTHIQINPIGVVHSPRIEISDDYWGNVDSVIHLNPNTSPDFNVKKNAFVYIVFYMHKVNASKITTASRHPRNDPLLPKAGILAQRAKNRPNQLGLSCVKIVDFTAADIHVSGLDAIDGTPVLYIKPFVESNEPIKSTIKEPKWLSAIMANYFTSKHIEDQNIKNTLTPPHIPSSPIALKPIGSLEKMKTTWTIHLDKKSMDSSATTGLEAYSHLYVLFTDANERLDFLIAKLVDVNTFTLQISELSHIPTGNIHIVDIKPYTILFLPS